MKIEIGENLTNMLITLVIYSPFIFICLAAVIWALVALTVMK